MATTTDKTAPETAANVISTSAHIHEHTVDINVSAIEEKTRGVEHDDAADLFAGESEVFEYTEEEATRVLRKLDFILLPMVRRT